MIKPKFLTPVFIENAVRFAMYFLALTVTPLIGYLLAPVWDWVGYAMFRELFGEIHTGLLWTAEWIVFHQIEKKYRAKKANDVQPKILRREERESGKEKPALLPLKNVLILTGICAGCILLISAIVGFEVKLFYDLSSSNLGGKGIANKLGVLGANVLKCIWIALMLPCCKAMGEEIVKTCYPDKGEWLVWVLAGGILMLFGLYDVFLSVAEYPLHWRGALTAVCYLLFYAVFPVVYYFTREHRGKTYFIVVLIYIL